MVAAEKRLWKPQRVIQAPVQRIVNRCEDEIWSERAVEDGGPHLVDSRPNELKARRTAARNSNDSNGLFCELWQFQRINQCVLSSWDSI